MNRLPKAVANERCTQTGKAAAAHKRTHFFPLANRYQQQSTNLRRVRVPAVNENGTHPLVGCSVEIAAVFVVAATTPICPDAAGYIKPEAIRPLALESDPKRHARRQTVASSGRLWFCPDVMAVRVPYPNPFA